MFNATSTNTNIQEEGNIPHHTHGSTQVSLCYFLFIFDYCDKNFHEPICLQMNLELYMKLFYTLCVTNCTNTMLNMIVFPASL